MSDRFNCEAGVAESQEQPEVIVKTVSVDAVLFCVVFVSCFIPLDFLGRAALAFLIVLHYLLLASKKSGILVLSDTSLGASTTDFVSNFTRASPQHLVQCFMPFALGYMKQKGMKSPEQMESTFLSP